MTFTRATHIQGAGPAEPSGSMRSVANQTSPPVTAPGSYTAVHACKYSLLASEAAHTNNSLTQMLLAPVQPSHPIDLAPGAQRNPHPDPAITAPHLPSSIPHPASSAPVAFLPAVAPANTIDSNDTPAPKCIHQRAIDVPLAAFIALTSPPRFLPPLAPPFSDVPRPHPPFPPANIYNRLFASHRRNRKGQDVPTLSAMSRARGLPILSDVLRP